MKELKYGTKVKVRKGAWRDFVGTVGSVDKDTNIADVTIPLFGSSTTIFIRATLLMKISDKHYQKKITNRQALTK